MMRTILSRPIFLLLAGAIYALSCSLAPAQADDADQATALRWWEKISTEEAADSKILGLWRFDTEDTVSTDESTHKATGKLFGATWSAEGRFGGALESQAGFPVQDKRHSLVVKNTPTLSPSDAFSMEMWLKAKPEDVFVPELSPVLADSKYVPVDHSGFMWSIGRAEKDGSRRFIVSIGLGNTTARWTSDSFHFTPGTWQHAAFSYNGKGEVSFWLDGVEIGRSQVPGAGGMASSGRDLSIGDRLGSNFNGFPGWIDEVCLREGAVEYHPLRVETVASVPAFLRFDKNAKLQLELRNLSTAPTQDASYSVTLPGGSASAPTPLPAIAPGATHTLEILLDSSLRPDRYTADVTLSLSGWGGEGKTYTATQHLPFVVAARPLPHRMPVVMWGLGGYDNLAKELTRLKDIGFTHCLGLGVDYNAVWEGGGSTPPAKPEAIRAGRDMLDLALANDVRVIATLSPAAWLRDAKAGEPYLRVNREGKPYDNHDVAGLEPRVQQFFEDIGTSVGSTYGNHPAFEAALLSTETRGHSQVSFRPIDVETAKKALGRDIPEEVKIKNGVEYGKLPNFPKDRVIADDDPILAYYHWFWTGGDGWNALQSRLNKGLHDSVKGKNFWTFFDPAVRVPSAHGSGGDVDFLSHWTYTYPDPIRIGLCADELFAMARANNLGQGVMKMTQLIWYRNRTAPTSPAATDGPHGTPQSPWLDQDAEAAYITIAPMHLREALWLKLARPISGIMYHGWGSLVQVDPPGGYTFTNPNTAPELKRLVAEVVEPLGPTLLQVPDVEADVLFLESFTSQMFARRGTYGWGGGWAADLYQVASRAQLQSEVIYEENLTEERLKKAKVLFMGDCDVLTQSIVARVKAFQKAGGLVVGDEELCPAIQPDILVSRYTRTNKAAEDFVALAQLSAKLKKDLETANYSWALSSENPDVFTRRRRAGGADYLFAANDRRESGRYVGGHGLVMEDGLPSDTVLQTGKKGDHAYDLVAHQEIPVTAAEGGGSSIALSLGPCEGRVIMMTDRPVEKLAVSAPEKVSLGGTATIEVAITDAEGKPIDAVVPVELRITDPEGAPAEPNGYYGAADGKLSISLDLAKNDRVGLWEIRVKEGASGKLSRTYLRVHSGAKTE